MPMRGFKGSGLGGFGFRAFRVGTRLGVFKGLVVRTGEHESILEPGKQLSRALPGCVSRQLERFFVSGCDWTPRAPHRLRSASEQTASNSSARHRSMMLRSFTCRQRLLGVPEGRQGRHPGALRPEDRGIGSSPLI